MKCIRKTEKSKQLKDFFDRQIQNVIMELILERFNER